MKVFRDWASLSALLRALGIGDEPSRILIVEDENYLREALRGALLDIGHHVDAREGVEREELPVVGFDFAFLDNYFSSNTLTGVTLTPELRKSCPQIRILGMSSDSGKNAEMIRLGANLAIPKSILRRLL